MRAVIDWIPREQGGRREPPSGFGARSYSTVVRFTDEPWPAPLAWSMVVKMLESIDEGYRWLADVDFLVDAAPHDSLHEGREFELYEGKKCVARGKLVGGLIPSPIWKTDSSTV
jgi:hypothetical protein